MRLTDVLVLQRTTFANIRGTIRITYNGIITVDIVHIIVKTEIDVPSTTVPYMSSTVQTKCSTFRLRVNQKIFNVMHSYNGSYRGVPDSQGEKDF